MLHVVINPSSVSRRFSLSALLKSRAIYLTDFNFALLIKVKVIILKEAQPREMLSSKAEASIFRSSSVDYLFEKQQSFSDKSQRRVTKHKVLSGRATALKDVSNRKDEQV